MSNIRTLCSYFLHSLHSTHSRMIYTQLSFLPTTISPHPSPSPSWYRDVAFFSCSLRAWTWFNYPLIGILLKSAFKAGQTHQKNTFWYRSANSDQQTITSGCRSITTNHRAAGQRNEPTCMLHKWGCAGTWSVPAEDCLTDCSLVRSFVRLFAKEFIILLSAPEETLALLNSVTAAATNKCLANHPHPGRCGRNWTDDALSAN